MPLRIDRGIPITPAGGGSQPLAFGPLTADAGPMSAEPTSLTEPHELEIEPVRQRRAMWCWAACVQMVLNYYERHEEQCAIVDRKRRLEGPHEQTVCGNERRFGQEGCHKSRVDDVWRAFNIQLPETPDDQPAGVVGFDKIKEEIDVHKSPVEVALHWNEEIGGGGHVVLIKGWANVDGKDVVIVNDPLASGRLVSGHEGRVTFEELGSAFGNGSWEHTWTNLRPE